MFSCFNFVMMQQENLSKLHLKRTKGFRIVPKSFDYKEIKILNSIVDSLPNKVFFF
jgi:hypothetical protein